jgi:hypothetical protein
MKMSLRITLAAAALGTLLVSSGHARDVSDAQGHIRSPDQARSYTVSPTQGRSTTGAFNTPANAAIHRPVADVTSKFQLRAAWTQVDLKFQAWIVTGRSAKKSLQTIRTRIRAEK